MLTCRVDAADIMDTMDTYDGSDYAIIMHNTEQVPLFLKAYIQYVHNLHTLINIATVATEHYWFQVTWPLTHAINCIYVTPKIIV